MARLSEIRSHVDALCNNCGNILNGRDVNGYVEINNQYVIFPDAFDVNHDQSCCGFCLGWHKEQDFRIKQFGTILFDVLNYGWKWVK